MKDHFIKIKNLVNYDLNPSAAPLAEADINRWILDLPVIICQLKEVMYKELMGPTNFRLLERWLHQIQEDCVMMMDTLTSYQKQLPDPAALLCFIMTQLAALLEHIEKQYNRYFNLKLLISNMHFEIGKADLKEKMNLLNAGLKRRSLSKDLLVLLNSTFNDFMAQGNCSYEKLIYMKELQAGIIDFSRNEEAGDFTENLIQFLIYYRFNDKRFENFFVKSLANELSAYFDVAGQLDRLFELEKQYVDQKETSLGCFDHFYPGLKETIVAYIKSTIKMLKKKMKNKAVLRPVDLNGRLKGSDYKVRVSVSVPSLSCLLRTLIEAGCIQIEERSHFLDFISRCFVTPGKGRNAGVLSVSNLKNTYEKVSETALKAIKTVVLKMLDILNRGFPPQYV